MPRPASALRDRVTLFLLSATVAKLALAAVLGGTSDIQQRFDEARVFLAGGDVLDPRNTGGPAFFLFGHYAITVLAFLIAKATGFPFKFWIKAPAILSDLGVSFLLRSRFPGNPRTAVAYMLNPITLILSVYHGQQHSVAVLAAVWAVCLSLGAAPVWAGVALAVAASVRQHFAMLIAPLLMHIRQRRVVTCAVFAGILVVLNLPILMNPHALRTLAPMSNYGIWGYSIPLRQGPRVLALAGLRTNLFDRVNDALDAYSSVLYILWGVVFLLWLWRRPHRDVWLQALVFFVGFYAVSPKFGVQWLIWAVPFWLVADYAGATIYTVLGTSYLLGSYWVWTFNARYGVQSITANLHVLTAPDLTMYLAVGMLGFLTWLYCVRSAWRLARS